MTGRHAPGPDGPARREVLRGTALITGIAGVAGVAGLTDLGLLGTPAAAAPVHSTAEVHEDDAGALHIGYHPFRPLGPSERAFSDIDGVQMRYIRSGDGVRRRATFRCRKAFYEELVRWVRRMRFFSRETGYPDLAFITSAGAYVNKSGQHGNGTAIDIDEVGWAGGRISRMIGLDWRHSDDKRRKRYYAIDATLRSSFRWTLDRAYNAEHHDHIHADFAGRPVIMSRKSPSDTGFIQTLCNEFMDAGLEVDRSWGPLTNAAFRRARRRLGTTAGDPHTQTWAYQEFLNAATRHAMTGRNFGPPPVT